MGNLASRKYGDGRCASSTASQLTVGVLRKALLAAGFLLTGLAPLNAALPQPDTLAEVAASVSADLGVAGLMRRVKAAPDTYNKMELSKGVFLVARRGLPDPNFNKTVILLIRHGEQGAMGVVVNRPAPVMLSRILPMMEELKDRYDPVFVGGPVSRNQIVLLLRAEEPMAASQHVVDDIYFSNSVGVLRALASPEGPDRIFRAFAGYAGWAPSQLESEILRGDWHLFPGDSTTVFDSAPQNIWPGLIRRSGGRWTQHRMPMSRHRPTSVSLGNR
ncbi:MAG: hypothetical protein DRQ37_04700 [Gammaproteobacteria bacterium]|nr:MAG: hypothetical protein DRQ37_04700 [Gammaproteobacteria bacterium]